MLGIAYNYTFKFWMHFEFLTSLCQSIATITIYLIVLLQFKLSLVTQQLPPTLHASIAAQQPHWILHSRCTRIFQWLCFFCFQIEFQRKFHQLLSVGVWAIEVSEFNKMAILIGEMRKSFFFSFYFKKISFYICVSCVCVWTFCNLELPNTLIKLVNF